MFCSLMLYRTAQGMFYRTARMLEAGIRPVFVFDGKPPELKRKQLEQRGGRWVKCGQLAWWLRQVLSITQFNP
jgi:hypothetical protein